MSTRSVGVALIASALCVAAHAQSGPGLGQPVSAADAAAWDISIQPDGTGLPPGSGNAAAGAQIFATHCAACHGQGGVGQPNDKLVGGQGTLTQLQQVRTVGSYWPYATTIFDYIRRAMPFQTPESLTNDQVYALTAYLLSENGIIGANDTMNAQTLRQVKMPNRDGFIMAYPKRADQGRTRR
ncbi:MAG TPA: cytochrome c [Gammaproteobacteria bacterium]|nr:cytochrome c [Gammaproteobacteria bacterium]